MRKESKEAEVVIMPRIVNGERVMFGDRVGIVIDGVFYAVKCASVDKLRRDFREAMEMLGVDFSDGDRDAVVAYRQYHEARRRG